MPILSLDDEAFENAEKYGKVDPGEYIVEVLEVKEKESKKNAGTMNIVASHKIVGNARGEKTPFDGKQIDYYVVGGFAIAWITAVHSTVFPTVEKLKERIKAAAAGTQPPFDINTENSKGKKAIMAIVNELYQGKERNQVSGIRPYVGPSA